MMASTSSRELVSGTREPVSDEAVAPARNDHPSLPEENLGLLPDRYDEDRLVLVPRDPRWLFLVWDLTGETRERSRREVPDGEVVLRLHVTTDTGATRSSDFEVTEGDGRFYARVPVPGVSAMAELGLRGPGDRWTVMLRSESTSLAVDRVRSGPPRFATLPLEDPLPGANLVPGQGIGDELGRRLLTAEEFRRLFGEGVPGSGTRKGG